MPITDTAPTPLCLAHDATFWPWRTWAAFAELPDKADITVIFPVIGFADWGLDAPLDIEETVALSVLRAALAKPEAPASRLLVLPPLRFVTGPHASCAFTVDVPTAHATLEEWCQSVAAAGFRRIAFFNSSPWNEELIDVAARDIRIGQELQMFCVNLSALGLDFAPWRGGERTLLRQLIAELDAPGSATPALDAASVRLARLFGEISARPSLPRNGALVNLTR